MFFLFSMLNSVSTEPDGYSFPTSILLSLYLAPTSTIKSNYDQAKSNCNQTTSQFLTQQCHHSTLLKKDPLFNRRNHDAINFRLHSNVSCSTMWSAHRPKKKIIQLSCPRCLCKENQPHCTLQSSHFHTFHHVTTNTLVKLAKLGQNTSLSNYLSATSLHKLTFIYLSSPLRMLLHTRPTLPK